MPARLKRCGVQPVTSDVARALDELRALAPAVL